MVVHHIVHLFWIHRSMLFKRQETCPTKTLSTREHSYARMEKYLPTDMKMIMCMYTILQLNHGARDDSNILQR